jgi:hypothetical protein
MRTALLPQFSINIEAGSGASRQGFAAELRYEPIEVLERKLTEIERKKERQAKSVSDLRLIASQRTQSEPAGLAPEWTRANILALEGPGIRRLIERFAVTVGTVRLNLK